MISMSVWSEISKLWQEQKMRMWWRHTKLRWMVDYAKINPKAYSYIGEGICPLCESKDVVFPINLEVCERCVPRIAERTRTGEIYSRIEKRPNFSIKEKRCIVCRKRLGATYYVVNTRICNKCTKRLGVNQRKIRRM